MREKNNLSHHNTGKNKIMREIDDKYENLNNSDTVDQWTNDGNKKRRNEQWYR